MAPSQSDVPTALTGGCLCGKIRYNIEFSKQAPFPPVSSTCQCTMCRKWTASLIAQFLVVLPQQLQPPLESHPTYKEYTSSHNRFRVFCAECGSPLVWRSGDDTSTVDLFLGTLDEGWLAPETKLSSLLARPNGTQFWMENAIPGVTDLVSGGKVYDQEGPDGIRTPA